MRTREGKKDNFHTCKNKRKEKQCLQKKKTEREKGKVGTLIRSNV